MVANPRMGFEVFGIIHGIIMVIVAIAFVWLTYKLGKLADAYVMKLKSKS